MSVVHSARQASIDEIAAEMDRRGEVIEKLEASLKLAETALRNILAIAVSDCAEYVRIADGIAIEAIAKLGAA
jgi:hypothetical protein